MTPNPFPDRLLELLADREVGTLSSAEQAELDALLAEHPGADDGSLEAAAVALMLGSLGEIEEMPAGVRSRVRGALGPAEPTLRLTDAPAPVAQPTPKNTPLVWSGWLAAAACLIVAAVAWFNRPTPTPTPTPTPAPSVAQARSEFLQTAPDVKTAAWGDWNDPEQKGVTGEVAWSEAEQTGYMTFKGLAVNDPTEEQYQLWIIDERGMGQRISGAIFDCDTETGQCVVKIDPGIEVHNAAAFAVTIEQPEGVWVSDMSRRVVIASLNG